MFLYRFCFSVRLVFFERLKMYLLFLILLTVQSIWFIPERRRIKIEVNFESSCLLKVRIQSSRCYCRQKWPHLEFRLVLQSDFVIHFLKYNRVFMLLSPLVRWQLGFYFNKIRTTTLNRRNHFGDKWDGNVV